MHGGIDWLESLLEQTKQADLTAGDVTSGSSPVTPPSDPDATRGRVTPKRSYKARARHCKCCHVLFTPKSKATAKYCSDRCRKKANRDKAARLNKGKSKPIERDLDLCTCEWCSATWFADASKHPKYCSPACRTAAYRRRKWENRLHLITGAIHQSTHIGYELPTGS